MKTLRYFLATLFTTVVLLPAALATPGSAPLLLLEATEAVPSALPHRAVPGSGIQGRFNPGSLSAANLRVQLPDGRELTAARSHEVQGRRGERTWVGEFLGEPGSLLVVTSYKYFPIQV